MTVSALISVYLSMIAFSRTAPLLITAPCMMMQFLTTAFFETFAPLKRTNVYMISQGASFVNISFVVDREELTEVVQDLHDPLFDNPEELETF